MCLPIRFVTLRTSIGFFYEQTDLMSKKDEQLIAQIRDSKRRNNQKITKQARQKQVAGHRKYRFIRKYRKIRFFFLTTAT